MKKSGVTLMSIVLYVGIFFAFSVFAIGMSSNMNYKTLSEKGNIWINEQIAILQFNLVKSAKSSNTVDNMYNNIVFSNNDEYKYDANKKIILKNGGILISDVEEFKILNESEITNIPANFVENLDTSISNICLQVKLKKYGMEKVQQIFVTSGDELNV